MPTLLAVDDNESVLAVLDFILAPRGYTVVRATSGQSALVLIAAQSIDGAIIDVHMPVQNGFEVCRLLREHAALSRRDVAVWMITGAHSMEAAKLAAEAGALDLFSKPFDSGALCAALDAEFARRDLASREAQ